MLRGRKGFTRGIISANSLTDHAAAKSSSLAHRCQVGANGSFTSNTIPNNARPQVAWRARNIVNETQGSGRVGLAYDGATPALDPKA